MRVVLQDRESPERNIWDDPSPDEIESIDGRRFILKARLDNSMVGPWEVVGTTAKRDYLLVTVARPNKV